MADVGTALAGAAAEAAGSTFFFFFFLGLVASSPASTDEPRALLAPPLPPPSALAVGETSDAAATGADSLGTTNAARASVGVATGFAPNSAEAVDGRVGSAERRL